MENETLILNAESVENDVHLVGNNEITELISNKPPAIVRWGTLYFLLLILFIGILAWFIQYPDKRTASGKLIAVNAPKEIVVKTNGKLIKLFVKENQSVVKGEVLGYIESTASHDEVVHLSNMLQYLQQKIKEGNTDEVIKFTAARLDSLGELQGGFQIFSNALNNFTNYLGQGFYLRKKNMLSADMSYMQRLHRELLIQKALFAKDVELTDSTFQAHEILKDEKVISAMDYRIEKSKLIARQMTLPQINSSIISNESQQHEKTKEIAELENQIAQQKNIFIQALNTIKSQADDWKKNYILSSPIDGKVVFTSFLQENQEVKAGQSVCFIHPGNSTFYAEVLIPQYNFGKVNIGQEVLLKFPAYPAQEFGSVKGRIEFISAIPTDSGYLSKVLLPDGLQTNYKNQLIYRTGFSLQAEIITERKSLLARLFDNLRSKFE